jgi:hypothetical protein
MCLPQEWEDDEVILKILPLKSRDDLKTLKKQIDIKGKEHVCKQASIFYTNRHRTINIFENLKHT